MSGVACTITNETSLDVSPDMVQKCVEETIRRHGPEKKNRSVSIAFVLEKKMRTLNRDYHGVDAPTDVLSFEAGNAMPDSRQGDMGDIIVCPSVLKKQAKENGKTLAYEICHVLAHGTLHLLGFHHEDSEEDHRRMHTWEEEIIATVIAR